MKKFMCPICNKEFVDLAELATCITNHAKEQEHEEITKKESEIHSLYEKLYKAVEDYNKCSKEKKYCITLTSSKESRPSINDSDLASVLESIDNIVSPINSNTTKYKSYKDVTNRFLEKEAEIKNLGELLDVLFPETKKPARNK